MIKSWKWKKDPRIEATQRDLQEQFGFLMEIRDKSSKVNRGIKTLRGVKQQRISSRQVRISLKSWMLLKMSLSSQSQKAVRIL